MAKKKQILKIKKQTWRRWRRDKRFVAAGMVLLVIIGFGLGVITVRLRPYNQHPRNLVWATDDTVQVPADLIKYLTSKHDCRGYSGTEGPEGVGIWGVYQISKQRFAKISYGCSTNLTLYIMAVKRDNKWQLLQPTEYFSTTGFLPKCTQIDKYQIDKSIEPYCIKEDGNARANTVQ